MNAVPSPRSFAPASAKTLTISIRLAVSALVLTAILRTAAASSLFWWRTAETISRQLASTINEQIVAARYQMYLPTEEELRAELARERELVERRLGKQPSPP